MELFSTIMLATAALSAFFKGANSISSVTHLRRVYPSTRNSADANSISNDWDSMSPDFDMELDEEAANSLAENAINFLERDGFDFGNERELQRLVSFLEAATGARIQGSDRFGGFINTLKEGGKTLFKHTKDFANKHAKGAVGEAVKMAVIAILKKGLPMFEKTYEDAVQRIPLNLRITYAPMAYNLWNELFKKFKIELPEELTPERFICKGMTKDQCDGVIKSAIMSSEKKKRSKRNGSGKEMDDDDESEGGDDGEDNGEIDFNLEDF